MFASGFDHSTVTMERPAPAVTSDRTFDRTLGRTAACVMAAVPGTVPALRHFARGVVRSWALPDSIDEAVAVIVSEFATNAVRHSGSKDVALLISLDHQVLTVEVKDRGEWRATSPAGRLEGATEACGGRGLGLVNAYSTGCVLWCESDGTRAVAKVPLARESR